jgi:hypothetical protein
MSEALAAGTVEGGNYEVIQRRLQALGDRLQAAGEALNQQRAGRFGSAGLTLLGHERIRTENNCVAADLVHVGGALLLGYNVSLGLKRRLTVADMLSLQTFERTEGGFAFHPVTDEQRLAFLTDRGFAKEFDELVKLYKDARLVQLRVTETKLLAVVQVGQSARDVKVFRWAVDVGGRITYLDGRGEREHTFPPAHDFEWVRTTRDDHVTGRHPHVNVLDTVFVETVGGDLTVKIEDSTEDGQGIFSEPVDDPRQSLDDADIQYARRGALVLLKVKPFNEADYRYLVFNPATRSVARVDALGHSCASLPDDHGVVFPGGLYLATGELKTFDTETRGLRLLRTVPSPNGEDVLYVFFRPDDGLYALYPYNLVRQELATPITAHGWSLLDDGTMIVFRAEEEPSRLHPAQVWSTPFVSAEHHQALPNDGSLLMRIGNKGLVRCVSDAFTLVRLVRSQTPTRTGYEALVGACERFGDAHHWAGDAGVGDLRSVVDEIRRTADLVIDEFDKVVQLQRAAARTLAEAEAAHARVLSDVQPEYFRAIDAFVGGMNRLRTHRGQLITMREVRYVDVARLEALEAQVAERAERVGREAVRFLARDEALKPLRDELDALVTEVEAAKRSHALAELGQRVVAAAEGIASLGEVVAALDVEDPTVKTEILERIGEVAAQGNRARALLDGRVRALRTGEGRAEFGAQLKLLGQRIASALAACDTPEATDEQLSRVLLQLEELEGRFGDLDEFLPQLAQQREEVVEAFEARKQVQLEERQRRAGSLGQAADRILDGVGRRARSFKDEAELASWFAADPMVDKVRKIAKDLAALGETVRADDIEARLKSARQDALRGLRDRLELFDGGDLVRFGKHRFTVNTRALEATLLPHGETLALHLTGTDFLQPIDDEALREGQPYWSQALVSEDDSVYRGAFLAHGVLVAADAGEAGLSPSALADAVRTEEGALALVRSFAADRYDEGYDRGVHDHDAARILTVLVDARRTADLLAFGPGPRALATLFWAAAEAPEREILAARSRSLVHLRRALGPTPELRRLCGSASARIAAFAVDRQLDPDGAWAADAADAAGRYLVEVLGREGARFAFSDAAGAVEHGFEAWLDDHGGRGAFDEALRPLGDRLGERFGLERAWLDAYARSTGAAGGDDVGLEAAALVLCRHVAHVSVEVQSAGSEHGVTGLLGHHATIRDGSMPLQLDTFLAGLERFRAVRVPGFRAFREARAEAAARWRTRLRLDELAPKVMTSFVRNQLVDQVYLPLVGDNLAKQLGAAGEGKRTDLMGLLLLVSPPGYGKTTLMEYVANRLGLTFVKVNGPALGHDVTSLDPAEAPNATARQEVEKIGLAFEMGNNVMLYLDDIQHCHPELLQKFISLCDGQRRIEGVWNGQARTYDLRGKKFCVVMAGNPYTETGAKFTIPDMLANRADTYNLGDVLSGRDEQFAMSFLENAVTSNGVLSPLAARPGKDLHALVRLARGEEVGPEDLSADDGAGARDDQVAVLRHLMRCQRVLLRVNAEYIRSAAMEDAYRTEPRFQLQGSYRNMNKLAEKVLPVMTEAEIEALITDHYRGESQTLTTGAESNLLRLGELRGTLTEDEAARWAEIKAEFRRRRMLGGDDDPAAKVTGALTGVVQQLEGLGARLDRGPAALDRLDARLADAGPALGAIAEAVRANGDGGGDEVVAKGLRAVAEALKRDRTGPLVEALAGLQLGGTDPALADVLAELRAIRAALEAPVQGPTNGHVANGSNGKNGSTEPRRAVDELVRARRLLLSQVHAVLAGDRGVAPNGDPTLAAALSVIERLTVHMATAARAHLTPDEHTAFVAALKRSVATAVTELADTVR